jgi:hypothetical protein
MERLKYPFCQTSFGSQLMKIKLALTSTRISHIAFKITKRIAGSSVLYVSISVLQDEMIGKFVNVKLQYKVYSRMSVCGTNP